MRFRHLLFPVLVLFSFVQELQAQNPNGAVLDSLAGFNEPAAIQAGINENASGVELFKYVEFEKRKFINDKYGIGLVQQFAPPQLTPFQSAFPAGKLGNQNTTFAAPCVNEGFEMGNITGWTATRGENTISSCVYPSATIPVTFPTGSLITTSVTPFSDAYYGFAVPNSPFPGNTVLRLNDNKMGPTTSTNACCHYEMVRLRSDQFNVTTTNFLYEFALIMVASSAHGCCDQPFVRVNLINSFGTPISCPLFTIAPPPGTCSSPGTSWTQSGSVYRNPTWLRYAIDLTNYIGSSTAVEIHVSNCAAGGHWSYAYFDSNCGELGFTLNGSSFHSAPTGSVNIQANCGANALLTAPVGLGPYTWNGPPGSGIVNNSGQSILTSMAGNYSISMNPPGMCLPITRVINLSFPPPTTVTASPATICSAGGSNSSTLTASGAVSYTWLPSGPSAPSTVVSPTTTTIYSVSVQSGTCIGTRTVQVSVSPDPTLTISNPNPNICSGGSTSLSAGGANSYTWNPGPLTGSQVVVSPIAPGNYVYTVTGATSSGCIDTETTIVTVSTASAISLFNITGSVCAGNPVMLVGTGYVTFTWIPSNPLVTGNPGIVTPTITTTYTALGGAGSCTNTATISVIADPGPSMTLAATPTITCPGGSATLTAIAPSAVGSLTWNPGAHTGTSYVVAPPTSTVYSVTGRNNNNCPATHTINKLVSPVPSPSISPASPTVCFGSSRVLTASGGSSFTWMPGGSNATTISVSPTVNTSYTLISSNGTCTNQIITTVTVVPTPTVNASASPTAICLGQSATLSPSGATGYIWQPGAIIGSTITVSPTSNTTYTVTGSLAGCTATRTVALVVNPLPTVNVSASPNPICRGNCSTLTPSGAQTYTVFPGGSTVVCPTVTTTYSVTGTSSLNCVSAQPRTISIVVNATPNIVFSPASPTVCFGRTVTVNAIGGTSYTWQPGNLVGNSQQLSPTVTTTYSVQAANAFGCVSSRTLLVTVLPSPTVNATATPTLICSGSSSTLSANGATTFTWMPGNVISGSFVATPSVTTNYTVTGSQGGCTATAVRQVSVTPTPTINASATPTAICIGQSATLSASGATSYTWNPGLILSSGTVVNPTVTTIYTVTGATGNCSQTRTVLLTVNPLPTINVSGSPSPICRGNCSTLTPSGAQTYTVLPGLSAVVCPTVTTTYSVTGASSLGCQSALPGTITIVVNATPNITFNPPTPTLCPGGTVVVNAIGGTSYTWNPGNLTGNSQALSPAATTIYTVQGANAFGCVTTRTVQVTVLPTPTINASASPTAICVGQSATLGATGGTSYTWNPGSAFGANTVVSPTVTTIYTVTGSNGSCSQTRTVLLTVNPLPTVNVSGSPSPICRGNCATLTPSGAQNYTVTPGLSTVVCPTLNTTYSVTGSSSLGCQSALPGTITIVVNATPNIIFNPATPTLCPGGTVVVNAIGGASYTWNPGNLSGNSQALSPAATTIYTVQGANAFGCATTRTVQVTVLPTPTINATASPTAICVGQSATLGASGGTSYTWNPGSAFGANTVVSPTVTTIYTVTGSNGGCSQTRTVLLTVNPLPTINVSGSPSPICRGNCSTLTPSGAQNYTVTPGLSTVVCPTLTTTYSVSGSSSLGCQSAVPGTITIVVNATPNIIFNPATPTLCPGGTVVVNAIGGTSYTWNPGNLTGNSQALSPAATTIYTVQGANAFGCATTRTVQVSVLPSPTINVTANPAAVCAAGCATLNPTGGTSYTYVNGGPVVCPTIATTYSVHGTGANGCVSQSPGTVVVNINPPPSITLTPASGTICAGGSILINATGGTSYTWNPGNLTGASRNLSPTVTTVYTVTGANAQGCIAQRTIQITVNPNPTVLASASPTAICRGGTAVLTASGAAVYTWNPGGSNANPLSVSPTVTTIYTVTGASSGCTGTGTVALVVNPLPTIAVVSNPTAVCAGSCATLVPSGASSYVFMNGGPVVCPSVTTVYSVSGTSSLGCVSASPGTVAVVVNTLPVISFNPPSATICAGGAATVTANGAVSYNWIPGNLTGSIQVLFPTSNTIYTVTGINAQGCSGTGTFALNVTPNPTVTASASPSIICNGQISVLTASGATTYSWQPGSLGGNPVSVNPTVTTIYTVTGQASGCSDTHTVQVTVNPRPVITASANPSSVCPGGCATITTSGAQTYVISPGNAAVVCPTTTTSYSVTGTSSLGCLSINTVVTSVVVNPIPTITLSPSSATICSGSSVTITAGGANSYTWQPGTLTGTVRTLSPSVTTIYTVSGMSGAGCIGQRTVMVTVIQTPTITASASSPSICGGNSTSLTANGAATYNWLPGPLTGSVVVVSPGTTTSYTVTGTTSGCVSNSAVVTVTVFNQTAGNATVLPAAVCPGGCATLAVTGHSGTVQWLSSTTSVSGPFANIVGATTPTYVNCGINANTFYRASITSVCGTTVSAVVQVSVNPTPVINFFASPASSICASGVTTVTASGANTFTWNPGGLVGATQTLSPSSNTTYTVSGTSGAGCVGFNTLAITVHPNPIVNASASPTAICAGSNASLTATGAQSYNWQPGNQSGSLIVVSPPSTTIYTVTGTSSLTCQSSRTVQLVVNARPTITVNALATALCAGGCTTLSPSGAVTYTYLNGGPIVCPTVTTTYSVNGTNASNCVSSSPGLITIVVNPIPVLTITPQSSTICAGSGVNVVVSGATNYTWQPGGFTGSNQTLSPTVTTVYTVTGMSAQGCSSQITATVNVTPLPVINAIATPTAICAGSTTTLSSSGAGSYLWMPGSLPGASVIVSPASTLVYTVTGTSLGCSITRTVLVTVNPLPVISIAATSTAGCPGYCATLTPSGAQTYVYLVGGPVVCPPSTTIYSITGTSSAGCAAATPGTIQLVVNPNPTISVTPGATICAGESTTLSASGSGTSYTWEPGTFIGSSFVVNPTSTTVYTVTSTLGNCTTAATSTVLVNPNPTVNLNSSPVSICTGGSATLTATGAASYSWAPISQTGSLVVESPAVTTIYTVTGTTAAGCSASNTVMLSVGTLPIVGIAASSNTICAGASATLTASGTLAYTWSPSGFTNTVEVVSPASTTIYTLFGSNGPGCNNTQTFQLVVSPVPVVTITPLSSTICAGNSATIDIAGATNYTWNPGPISGNQAVVSPVSSTTYTVDAESLGCVVTATAHVNVQPIPTILANATPTSHCISGTSTLSANGAANYTWFPGALAGANVTVNVSATTVFTVEGVSSSGCQSTQTVEVTVLPLPTVSIVSSGTAVCIGSNATLTASGALNYSWNPGGSTGSMITVSPVSPTTYTVIGDNGACVTTATVSLGINQVPSITAVANPTLVCGGSPVSFTATGADTYTWMPSAQSGSVITDNPNVSTIYTVTGEDANGCTNTANVTVSVNPSPTMIPVASPTAICIGQTASLSATGALSYTWEPGTIIAQSFTDAPTATVVYTVYGTDPLGCIGSETIQLGVFPTPTVNVSVNSATVCAGSPVTLTATGATNYSWMPSGGTGSTVVDMPVSNTTYTVIGDNGGVCFSSATVDVFVNPLPANVTASASGTITCASPSVDLTGASTSTGVGYSWSGPSGYTSSVQNPTGVTAWGIYTLAVTDTVTGCSATATVDVPTDNSIPSVTATTSGSITCGTASVTLNAANTTFSAGYSWGGPGGFTGTTQSVTAGVAGQYTVTVTDLISTCSSTGVVTIGTHTEVLITASITPATCTAGVANNDGMITVMNFNAQDRFDLVAGITYTGAATYSNAIAIPSTGIVTANLANPTTTTPYTLRLFDSEGCVKDTTLLLIPVDCSIRTLGLAKAVSSVSANLNDGSYDVIYSIVVKNYDTAALREVTITDNLANALISPATFTVVSVTANGGSLSVNTSYDGVTETALTTTLSEVSATSAATIQLRVRVLANGFFGPFMNSASGTAVNNISVTVTDVSSNGTEPDTDNDGNPGNDASATPLTLDPQLFFGITKEASFVLADNLTSYDVTYTVTVHNRGNDTLRNVSVRDPLLSNTVKLPATFSIRSGPAASGNLVANAGFNGGSDVELLNPATSRLLPGEVRQIVFSINIIPDTVTVVSNSAVGDAVTSFSSTVVRDTSMAGSNPDTNNNGVWNEYDDNRPTVVVLPSLLSTRTVSLFIPGGFSPDGDNINDVFVIKGLPKDVESSLTIFNRWGNRIYHHSNYLDAEPWDARPNVAGTLGKTRVAQGTYYYVLEIKDGRKPITGFIAIEY